LLKSELLNQHGKTFINRQHESVARISSFFILPKQLLNPAKIIIVFAEIPIK
jgi:hypothetical protein